MLCALIATCLIVNLMKLNGVNGSPACMNTCGGNAVSYPFGTTKGCGSKVFQNYVKCSKGKFLVITQTGQYEIIKIDYENKILIVNDKKMSTCSSMRRTSHAFGLEEGTPFTVQGARIVLLACIAPTSIVQSSPNSICDANGAQVCQSLYGYCPSITNLGLSMNSAIRSCCLLKKEANMGSPSFNTDIESYGCLSYTSIYRFGPGIGYGSGFSSDYRNPSTWSFGIPLHYEFDEAAYSQGCHDCEASRGACAFDDNSNFLHCVCPSGLNVSTQCPPGAQINQATTSTYGFQTPWKRVIIHLLLVAPLLYTNGAH